jgi:hypothetical protein
MLLSGAELYFGALIFYPPRSEEDAEEKKNDGDDPHSDIVVPPNPFDDDVILRYEPYTVWTVERRRRRVSLRYLQN